MLVGQAGVAGVAFRAEEDEEGSVLLSGAICLKLSSDVKQVQISLHLADPPMAHVARSVPASCFIFL